MHVAPVAISQEALCSVLGNEATDDRVETIDRLRVAGSEIANPVGLYIPFHPELENGEMLINGVRFSEPFIYSMLSGSDIVVPYVATCGVEIDTWSEHFENPFERLVLDKFRELCLFQLRDKLLDTVKAQFFDITKNISAINPGSLAEWPLAGQIPLFKILGSVTEDIGVSLTDKLWMIPIKSVSGFLFQSDEAYENCQLCPRPDCPNRRVDYIG